MICILGMVDGDAANSFLGYWRVWCMGVVFVIRLLLFSVIKIYNYVLLRSIVKYGVNFCAL